MFETEFDNKLVVPEELKQKLDALISIYEHKMAKELAKYK